MNRNIPATRPRRSNTKAVVGSLLLIGAVGAGAVGLKSMSGTDTANAEQVATTAPTATATATTGNLSTSREFTATVGFGKDWALPIEAKGMITEHPAQGTQIEFGQFLLRIDNKPVILVKGDVPLYRALEYKSNKKERIIGDDVKQLQEFLVASGVKGTENLKVDGVFDRDTEKAVKAWQKAMWLQETGKIDRSRMIFSPTPVRVASEGRVGTTYSEYKVSAATATVTVATNSRDRLALPVGTAVKLQVGEQTFDGKVTAQDKAKSDDGNTVYNTTIEPTTALPGDTTSAKVLVETVLAENSVLVPASALVALAEGGFAVEVVNGDTKTLTRVEIGEVLDGQVQIKSGIEEGTTVVVAAS